MFNFAIELLILKIIIMKRIFALVFAVIIGLSANAQKHELSSAPFNKKDIIGHTTSTFNAPKGVLGEDFE